MSGCVSWRTTVLNSPNTDPVTLPPVVDSSMTAAVTAISKALAYFILFFAGGGIGVVYLNSNFQIFGGKVTSQLLRQA